VNGRAAAGVFIVLTTLPAVGGSPRSDEARRKYVESLVTPDYAELRKTVSAEFSSVPSGFFGEAVPGLLRRLPGGKRQIALTFDACGGGYNKKLIEYLRSEKIPATLFVTGVWADAHPSALKILAADPLFQIENHGLLHRLCTMGGQSLWDLPGARNPGDIADEIELNARKLEKATGRRPRFFRPAGAQTDEATVKISRRLGAIAVGFNLFSDDVDPSASTETVRDHIVQRAGRGAIVLMHFNHPEWYEEPALRAAVPALRSRG
jgi:peptidoglycan/xylan/chitin deacetylase (PgdA/CDA1 family)